MPGQLADDPVTDMLNAYFRGQALSPPASVFIGLSLTVPSDANGTGAVEPVGNGYGRVEVPCDDTHFGSANRQVYILDDVTFPNPTAPWGTILAVLLWTTSGGGSILGWAPCPPAAVTAGAPVVLPSGYAVIEG